MQDYQPLCKTRPLTAWPRGERWMEPEEELESPLHDLGQEEGRDLAET